ncbi:MAG: hypothetical protein ACJAXX_002935 [Roseivirga sp.]|jgi:hypothetical protein
MIQKKVIYCIALMGLMGIWGCSNEDDLPLTALPAVGAIIDPNVGGVSQPNQVFIDLSEASQTVLARNGWDLGFYSGDQSRVVLNSALGALVRPIAQNDLNLVTAADTMGFASQMDIDVIFSALFGPPAPWLTSASSWADDPSGDPSKTAFAEVSPVLENNQVHIINRGKNPDGTQRGWMKVRVVKSSSGYTLQYAEINATSFQELEIPKNDNFNVVPVSFESGIVSSFPEKKDWDFKFTVFTDLLPINNTVSIPYTIRDYVLINSHEVEVARVAVTAEITYDSFDVGSIGSLDFSSNANVIGTSWRNIAQPNSDLATGVKDDIFYVLKDAAENYYKVQFTRLVDAQTGERGNPQLQFKLVVQPSL